MSEKIINLANALAEKRQIKDNLKKELKTVEPEIKSLEYELASAMNEAGIKSIKIDGIGNVIRVEEQIAKIADKQAFGAYLVDKGLEDLWTKTMNFHTLNKLNLESLETNGVDLPGCESTVLESITIRKA
jgi:hypothetical protein